MKSSISSLLGSKNLNLHHSTVSPSHRHSSLSLSKSITHLHPTPFNFIIFNPKFKFHSLLAPIMASSFKPEQSRPPPVTQLLVTAGKERNIAQARKAIEEAAGKGAQLVVLPIWSYWYRYLLWHLISGTGNDIGSKRAADNQLYVAPDSPARDLDLVMWMGPLHSTLVGPVTMSEYLILQQFSIVTVSVSRHNSQQHVNDMIVRRNSGYY